MITFSQQYNIITKVFTSFRQGKKVSAVKHSEKEIERAKLFLKPSKFESQTIGNFSIVVLYSMFNKRPTSNIEFMKILNKYNKADILEALSLKTDLKSYRYLREKDKNYMAQYNESPYNLFKENKISLFSVNDYYNNNPGKIQGRIMSKDIKDINVLVEHFNLGE